MPVRIQLPLALVLLAAVAVACEEKPAVWDGTFEEPVVRPEHPRPDLRRVAYVNLNTTWQFAYDPDDVGVAEGWFDRDDVWDHEIQVPYAWEAPLAGLEHAPEQYSPAYTADAHTYRGVAWYRLALPGHLPEGDDWWVVFGAVDFEATVWIDGVEAGHHRGGFAPFAVNLSAAATGEAPPVIVVRVEDGTELNDRAQPVGKQGGTWYTRVSGIWQTVYLEQRPPVFLEGITATADPEAEVVWIALDYEGSATATIDVTLDGEPVGTVTWYGTAGEEFVSLDRYEPWTVDDPVLYDVRVTLRGDEGTDDVRSYFGLSQPGIGWIPGRSPADTDDPHQQAKAFTWNGEPIYPRCVLDQSYWPGGLFTAPSLDDIRADLQLAKDFGFNCIRLHIKPDEPVKLRLIDEMGFYLVYDIPSLDMQAENTADFVGRTYFQETLEQVIERDRNHPSLLLWVVFNENWGLSANGSLSSPTPLADDPGMQDWVHEMVARTRELDPARPVEDNSAGGIVGVFEHVGGDSNSFHLYEKEAADWRTFLAEQDEGTFPGSEANYVGGAVQDGAPWWNSEFAAFSFLGNPDGAYCALFGALNEQRRVPRLAGWTLTQLTDVEYELNGLVDYDRGAKDDLCEAYGVALADVFGDDFVGFDWLPGHVLEAGATVEVPVWFSQWSSGDTKSRYLSLGWESQSAGGDMFMPTPYHVTPIPNVTIQVPATAGTRTLVAEVFDGDQRLCANRLEVEIQ